MDEINFTEMLPLPQVHQPQIIDLTTWEGYSKKYISATDTPALFGKHYDIDVFTLWHLKNTDLKKIKNKTKFMHWGLYLEAGLVKGFYDKFDWGNIGELIHENQMYKHPDESLGLVAVCDYSLQRVTDKIIVEAKYVTPEAFKKTWLSYDEQGNKIITPPIGYEMQVQAQLLCSGWHHALLIAWVGDSQEYVFYRGRNQAFLDKLTEKVRWFRSLPEAPNKFESEIPLEYLKMIFKPIKGDVGNLREVNELPSLCAAWLEKKAQAKLLGIELEETEENIRKYLGEHELAYTEGFQIKRITSFIAERTSTVKAHTRDYLQVKENFS